VWKLANPTNQYMNRDCPADAEDFERVRGRLLHPQ
jgi:cytoplasmic FMR1 interacting protein